MNIRMSTNARRMTAIVEISQNEMDCISVGNLFPTSRAAAVCIDMVGCLHRSAARDISAPKALLEADYVFLMLIKRTRRHLARPWASSATVFIFPWESEDRLCRAKEVGDTPSFTRQWIDDVPFFSTSKGVASQLVDGSDHAAQFGQSF